MLFFQSDVKKLDVNERERKKIVEYLDIEKTRKIPVSFFSDLTEASKTREVSIQRMMTMIVIRLRLGVRNRSRNEVFDLQIKVKIARALSLLSDIKNRREICYRYATPV
jgi:hypothetical protein